MTKEAGGIHVAHVLNAPGEVLHVDHRLGVAQLDRPLVELSCAAEARGHALSARVQRPEHAGGFRIILSRGPLEPYPCLLAVHSDAAALAVHEPDLILAQSVTRLATHLVRRHRPRVIDRHALAPVVDASQMRSGLEVALARKWANMGE